MCAVQLGFPWRRDRVFSFDTRHLHGNATLDIDLRTGGDEVELLLTTHDISFGREQLSVHIRVGHPAWCRQDGWRCPWNMSASTDDGVFATAVEWALRHLDPQLLWFESRDDARSAAIRAACEATAARALGLADKRAREVAARITDSARMFVYAALLEDSGGHIAELIDICPGLLALAAAHELENVAGQLRRGTRLRDLLHDVVRRAGLRHPQASALVRRAPSEVSARMLYDVSRIAQADINDMSPTREGRAHWFETIAAWSRVSSRLQQLDAQRVGGFVSRYADEIWQISQQRAPIEMMFGDLCDWLEMTGAPAPSRRSSPGRIWASIDEWRERLWRHELVDPAQPLAAGPCANARIPEIEAECIATAGELYREGQLMRHCVGSKVSQAVAGRLHLYRAIVGGQRVTISIAPLGDMWQLVEAAGVANTAVRRRDVIERWVRSLRYNRPGDRAGPCR